MSKSIKILCLALLISVCIFPASAFASSSKASENKKSFLDNIISVFSISNWWDDDDDWRDDDDDWWDKNKVDSFKIWERYYCY